MNNRYIELEQFNKELTDKQQKDIIEWWKDNVQIGDLISSSPSWSIDRNLDFVIRIKSNGNIVTTRNDCSIEDCMPLLSESQCREYIEYKTNYTIQIEPYTNILGNSGTDISLTKNGTMKYCYEYHGKSLLQAYWEIIKQL